jgi:hypothetical protein
VAGRRATGCRALGTTRRSSPSPAAPCAAIVDRDGRWLARSSRDRNGEAVREYRDDSISHVVGYASRRYGTAGLERTYNTELIGLGGADPFGGLLDKFATSPREPLGLRLTLDLRLQRAAVAALGADRGAVVMLDPATGEILALASTPTYDASAIADPDTATSTFQALRDDASDPLLPRATLGRYVPGSVFKIVTAVAGLGTGAISPETTFERQPRAERRGLLVSGYRIRTATTADRRHGARPHGRHRGQLQRLVRARRARDGRRQPRRSGRPARPRRPDPVRPADGRQPRHRRRRAGARRVRRRRRARLGRVRPGRDVRDAPPDGSW